MQQFMGLDSPYLHSMVRAFFRYQLPTLHQLSNCLRACRAAIALSVPSKAPATLSAGGDGGLIWALHSTEDLWFRRVRYAHRTAILASTENTIMIQTRVGLGLLVVRGFAIP